MGAFPHIGIILFTAAVAFTIITLPVEFNASARAIAVLRANRVLSEEELEMRPSFIEKFR